MALLRSVGIPARFRVLEFKGNDPEEWEGILPSFAVSRMPERWPHYFAEVYIEGKWIMADATFDKYLIPDIEDWDGENDVCSVEDTAVLSDMGTFASIEEEAKKLDEKYRVPSFLVHKRLQRFLDHKPLPKNTTSQKQALSVAKLCTKLDLHEQKFIRGGFASIADFMGG